MNEPRALLTRSTRLDARGYHALPAHERAAVDAWLTSFLGDAWRDELILEYCVIAEGAVVVARMQPFATTIEYPRSSPPLIWSSS